MNLLIIPIPFGMMMIAAMSATRPARIASTIDTPSELT